MEINREKSIVFMGTPDFAVGILQAMMDAGCRIVGVVTTPDKPSGRGLKVNRSAVKEFLLQREAATGEKMPLLQPVSLKDPEFIETLQSWHADLFVVVAFRMLPKIVWGMPPMGTFNLHASLLPQYRGAAPINWAIINGDTRTGVTTFFLDEHIDTGAIIRQSETEIGPDENVGSLHDRLMEIGCQLVCESIDAIFKGEVTPLPQPEIEDLRPAPKLNRETGLLNWKDSAQHLHNLIRGLSPYPGAHSLLHAGGKEQDVKIYAAQPVAQKNPVNVAPGTISTDGKTYFRVQCGSDALDILELQMPGKKRLTIREFLAGWRPTEAFFE